MNQDSKPVKDDCSNHKKDLFGEKDMKVAARATADMHYGSLTEYLYELSKCIEADAIKDNDDGKEKLAAELQYAGMSIFESSLRMERVFKISKPFMNDKTPQP